MTTQPLIPHDPGPARSSQAHLDTESEAIEAGVLALRDKAHRNCRPGSTAYQRFQQQAEVLERLAGDRQPDIATTQSQLGVSVAALLIGTAIGLAINGGRKTNRPAESDDPRRSDDAGINASGDKAESLLSAHQHEEVLVAFETAFGKPPGSVRLLWPAKPCLQGQRLVRSLRRYLPNAHLYRAELEHFSAYDDPQQALKSMPVFGLEVLAIQVGQGGQGPDDTFLNGDQAVRQALGDYSGDLLVQVGQRMLEDIVVWAPRALEHVKELVEGDSDSKTSGKQAVVVINDTRAALWREYVGRLYLYQAVTQMAAQRLRNALMASAWWSKVMADFLGIEMEDGDMLVAVDVGLQAPDARMLKLVASLCAGSRSPSAGQEGPRSMSEARVRGRAQRSVILGSFEGLITHRSTEPGKSYHPRALGLCALRAPDHTQPSVHSSYSSSEVAVSSQHTWQSS